MSAIKVVNSIPASTAPSVEFRLFQGDHQVARFGTHAGGSAEIPTAAEWTVQASTSMGDFTLTSNTFTFNESSVSVIAQVLTEAGYYDFQIVKGPGVRPSTITVQNRWRGPVQFSFMQSNPPVQTVIVVDEHNTGEVSTAQEWTAYAIANGITTQTVTITNPNATVTAIADTNGALSLILS